MAEREAAGSWYQRVWTTWCGFFLLRAVRPEPPPGFNATCQNTLVEAVLSSSHLTFFNHSSILSPQLSPKSDLKLI